MEECIIIWKDSVSRSDDFTHTVLKPLPPLISLRGTGVPMETVSSTNPPRPPFKSRNSTATVSLSCDLKKKKQLKKQKTCQIQPMHI